MVTDANGVATTAMIQFLPGVTYTITVTISGTSDCDAQTSTSPMTVTGTPGKASTGSGTQSVGDGRVAKIFHQVTSTTTTDRRTKTRTTTYRGALSWEVVGLWRFTGTIASRYIIPTSGRATGWAAFVTDTCDSLQTSTSGVRTAVCGTITGTGTIQRWDPNANKRQGAWVATSYGTVGFMATVNDGGTTRTCTTTKRPVCTTRAEPDQYALILTANGQPITTIPTSTTPTLVTGTITNTP